MQGGSLVRGMEEGLVYPVACDEARNYRIKAFANKAFANEEGGR